MHHKFRVHPILGKEEFDANFKSIGPGFIRQNSRVGFLSFLAVDAVFKEKSDHT